MDPEIRHQSPRDMGAWRRALEWVPFVAPPLILLADLQASYLLVPYTCRTGAQLPIHLVSVVAFMLDAGAFALAWRVWRGAGSGWPGDEPEPRAQARFLGMTGLLTSAYFALVVVAMAVPRWVVGACL